MQAKALEYLGPGLGLDLMRMSLIYLVVVGAMHFRVVES